MGPTNIALVRFYQADQQVRAAQARLEAATKDVRIQERRVNELAERQRLAATKLRELQARSGQFDLDIKSRDAHIEKLRSQQQAAHNNKEYQAFLVEINTQKVDKAKVEDEMLAVMEQVEKQQKEAAELGTMVESERAKLEQMKAQINDRIKALQAEIDVLVPERDAAAQAVSPRGRAAYDRLAERFEGEALAALIKPDHRREEYACGGCMMDLVTDVYNKLHSRDDLVFCPSCHRILYIPDDLPPEVAVKTKPVKKEPKEPREPRASKRKAAAVAPTEGAATQDSIEAAAAPEPTATPETVEPAEAPPSDPSPAPSPTSQESAQIQ